MGERPEDNGKLIAYGQVPLVERVTTGPFLHSLGLMMSLADE